MFLDKLVKEIPQEEYIGKVSLEKLKLMDISTIENRFLLLLEILKYFNALQMFPLVDGTNLVSLRKVKDDLYKCCTYASNRRIVGGTLKGIAKELSYEMILENNGDYDFTVIQNIIKGKGKPRDFLKKDITQGTKLKVWSITGGSGKVYEGKGKGDLFTLKADQLKDMLAGIRYDPIKDEESIEIRDFMFDKKNDSLIKKNFGSGRNGFLNFLSAYVTPGDESKMIGIYREYKRKKAIDEESNTDDLFEDKTENKTEDNTDTKQDDIEDNQESKYPIYGTKAVGDPIPADSVQPF